MRVGIGIGIPGGQFVGSGGIVPPNAPTIALSSPPEGGANFIVGQSVMATATTSDTDGKITTAVKLYDAGVLVGSMVQGPAGTWTLQVTGLTAGSHSFVARRFFASGTVDSGAAAITVLAALGPDQITSATLLAWQRNPESIQISATLLAGGTTPPGISLSGTLTIADQIHITCPTGGAVGTALVNVFLNGTQVLTNQSTTAGTVAIPGSTANVVFPASGTYNTNNTWDSICRWNDKTVNAHNFVNATASQLPKNIANQQNGITSILSDGVSDILNCTTTLGNTFAGNGINTPFTYVAFLNILAVPANAELMTAGNTGNVVRAEVQISSTAWKVRRHDNSGNDSTLTSNIPATGGLYIVIWRFDGTNSLLRLNGVDVIGGGSDVSGVNTCAAALTLNNVSVFAQKTSGVGNWINAHWYEQVFYSGAISDAEIARLEAYF